MTMKKIAVVCLFCLINFVCFAKKVEEPDWFKNYKSVYTVSEFIAMKGTGNSGELAKADAAAQIARYFVSNVVVNTSASSEMTSDGTNVTKNQRILTETEITSELSVVGMEYTVPFYNKPEKKWYAVAFINRADAWFQFKPKIDGLKNEFMSFYKKAQSESDSFAKVSFYRSAVKVGDAFLEKLEYGRLISPNDEEKYASDRELVSEIPSLLALELKNLTVNVSVCGDYGDIIATAVKKVLSENGFVVGNSGNYLASVIVESNVSGSEPLVIMPSVEIKVESKDGKPVCAYSTAAKEKTPSYSLDKAQKKAFPLLAEKILQEMKF